MRIALCLLVWNELEGCRKDVPRLPLEAFDQVYAVDGGSTDGTVEYLQENGIVVFRQTKKGLNGAYWCAAERSTCDAVVVFLPKGTTPPGDVLCFRPLFESGHDLVVASRNMRGARNEEDDFFFRPRKWMVMALSSVVSLAWRREGPSLGDVLHGFRGFTVDAFRRMHPSGEGISIDLELAVRSYRLRIRRAEFPTQETPRFYSASRFKFWPTGKQLLRFLWHEVRS